MLAVDRRLFLLLDAVAVEVVVVVVVAVQRRRAGRTGLPLRGRRCGLRGAAGRGCRACRTGGCGGGRHQRRVVHKVDGTEVEAHVDHVLGGELCPRVGLG